MNVLNDAGWLSMTILPGLPIFFSLILLPSLGFASTLPYPMMVPFSGKDKFTNALAAFKNDPDKSVATFYQKIENNPIWFFQGNLTKCGYVALETLKNAALEGLTPHDYEDATQALHRPEKWENAEIILTKRFLEYINHVRTGRTDPSRISRDIKLHRQQTGPIEHLLDAIHEAPLDCPKLCHMAPPFPQYQRLKDVLKSWRELARTTKNWPKIKGEKALKVGDINAEVKALRQILTLHGDLRREKDKAASSTFDKVLDAALRQFQKRHTLEPDGVVGGKTKDALNQPIDKMIRKVIYNMERLRWLPENLGDRYIIVNVAGYQVQAYEKSHLKLTVPAVVGKPSRRTPLFYAPLKSITINPSWGVPYNILVHDKIPKMMNDPDYARRSGFTVTDDLGYVVDPENIDWENEGKHYHLRQKPGARNALGRLKFFIENPYAIYLHDTPDKDLFEKAARPFSSGCVRLETPIELAAWVLDNTGSWSSSDIQNAIHNGKTQTITPKNPLSVFFTYQTVWVDEDNLVHMSDDPYRLDAKMEKVLHPHQEQTS